MMDLHQSTREIDECIAAHGMRPLERLWNLGLLTPALNAAHMVELEPGGPGTSCSAPASRSLCAPKAT